MSFAQPFKNYEILDRIGAGAMGTVFKARQKHMNRVVALKVLKPSLARDKHYVDRLRREARIVGKLNHPNIVTGYDLGEEGGYHFFVMELIEGRSLRELLGEWGSFPEDQVLDVAIQVTDALAHASRSGVIHRDVKPGNVLIDDSGRVKLTDMGLAKGPTDLTLTRDGATVGTPQYISPEQARNPANADIRSDLYSLGGTLFHMATGQAPFRADGIGQLIDKVLHERPPSVCGLNPQISPGLGLVIGKLLAKDPARRYQSPDELLADLRRVQRAERPRVDPTTLETRGAAPFGRLWWRSRRALVIVGSLAAGAVVVAAIALSAGAGAAGEDEDVSAYRAAIATELDATTDFADRFERLRALARTAASSAQRAALDDARRASVERLRIAVTGVIGGYLDEAAAPVAEWLARPEHWRDENQFLDQRVEPELRAAVGFRSAALPDEALRADVAAQLGRLREAVRSLAAKRDAEHVDRFRRWLRTEVDLAVRARLAAADFRGAIAVADERINAFYSGARPGRDQLSDTLAGRLASLGETRREAIRNEVLIRQRTVAQQMRLELAGQVERLGRLREDVRRRQGDPELLRVEVERVRRRFDDRFPTGDRFALDDELDPWGEVRARLGAFVDEAEQLAVLADEKLLDDALDLAYRVLVEVGARRAVRVLELGVELAGAEARRLEHFAALTAARRLVDATATAVLGGADEEFVDVGSSTWRLRQSPDGLEVADRSGRPARFADVDWPTLAADSGVALDDPGAAAAAVMWSLARGAVDRAESALAATGATERAFLVGEVWPRLRNASARRVSPLESDARAAVEAIQAAQRAGDFERAREGLEAFDGHFGGTAVASETTKLRARISIWVERAEHSAALLRAFRDGLRPGVEVRVQDGVPVVFADVTRLSEPAPPAEWVVEPGGSRALELPSGDLAAAVARRLIVPSPFPEGARLDVTARLGLRIRPPDRSPSLIVVSVHGVSVALAVLPGGAVAAAALAPGAVLDTATVDRALAEPLRGLVRQSEPVVVPGAWHELSIRLDARRGDVDVSVAIDETAFRLEARVAAPAAAPPMVEVVGLPALAVRTVELRGRAGS